MSSCGSSGPREPRGEYVAEGLYDSRMNGYRANFKEGGRVTFYIKMGKSVLDRACNTEGSWRMGEDAIVISGLYNPNCPEVSKWNGKAVVDGLGLKRK